MPTAVMDKRPLALGQRELWGTLFSLHELNSICVFGGTLALSLTRSPKFSLLPPCMRLKIKS